MKRLPLATVLLFSVTQLSVSHPTGREQEANDQSRQDNNVRVFLDVRALNRKTAEFVDGLAKEDFIVSENGVQQQIISLTQEQWPISIVLLIDVSGSMKSSIKESLAFVVPPLKNLAPQDEMAIMTFTQKTTLVQDFTNDPRLLEASIVRLRGSVLARGLTGVHEAIFQSAAYMAAAGARGMRGRAIVAITDNQSTEKSPRRQDEVLDAIIRSRSTVHALILPQSYSSPTSTRRYLKSPQMTGDVARYVNKTAGVSIGVFETGIAEKLNVLMKIQRNRYMLAYRRSSAKKRVRPGDIKLTISPASEKQIGKLALTARLAYTERVNKP
jgi:VWFA-related protein